ncbi:transmembrane protein [Cystoisospora suis]|uniref:Transmembrane protein n=1 Tax=Cystoisospora suis TaxID=483139 RepID=A0A2C6KRS4_9APIC|nr:transmembrane protein [Cystoisospora suis]
MNQRFSGLAPLFVSMSQVVLQRGDGNKFCIKEPSVGSFLSLCSWSKLYVFVQVKDDEEEHQVMHLLERIKAFDHGLQRYRVMFSSTREGRASMVRQLQPLTHIDADGFIAITLDGKVPNVVCLREPLKDCVDVLQAALHSPGS